MTIRVDDDVAQEIERLAREEGLSWGQAVSRLLRRATGGDVSTPRTGDRIGASLDWFIGSWTPEQADAVDAALRDFARSDEEAAAEVEPAAVGVPAGGASLDLCVVGSYRQDMRVVASSELRSHLGEYLRSVREGEDLLITARGEVVAELRRPGTVTPPTAPAGLVELLRRGATEKLSRNDPSRYRSYERVVDGPTARELVDWDRGDC